MIACETGCLDVARLLLDRGAKVDATDEVGWRCRTRLLAGGPNALSGAHPQYTALSICRHTELRGVHDLAIAPNSRCAIIHVSMQNGRRPLEWAEEVYCTYWGIKSSDVRDALTALLKEYQVRGPAYSQHAPGLHCTASQSH
jgi:hypothetical protein